MKKANLGLLAVVALVLGVSQLAVPQGTQNSKEPGSEIKGLPASDVLGSEDIWDNPTFVGGVQDGGPAASSEY